MIKCEKPNIQIEGTGEDIIQDFANVVAAVIEALGEGVGAELAEVVMNGAYEAAIARGKERLKKSDAPKINVKATLAAIASLIQDDDDEDDEGGKENDDGRDE